MHNPSEADMTAAKRILRYLAGTSTLGFCVILGDNIVSWSSKKQPTISRSSTEVEYRALATVAAEVTWLQFLLKDLQVTLSEVPLALCDNISTTYLAYNLVLHSRSKHIALDYHFVREKVTLGDLIFKHIPTHLQLADAFTKPLSTVKFLASVSNLSLV
ncbi:hypothetical protein LIER_37950 [Lithospermum erythrorhizon]|uniref:Uncharacterized protein n=1 Tax=Lithospermum erythrorhizon TaxID=34254 RepID=A0AAV3PSG4_LITER